MRVEDWFLTDWRGDPDELMRPGGPTVAEVFSGAAKRGVVVRGLIWRSHPGRFRYSEENRHLGHHVEAAGGEVLLDQRVRRGGSHPQKLVVLRHPGRPERDVAFAGGIDLGHSRRDDQAHGGDYARDLRLRHHPAGAPVPCHPDVGGAGASARIRPGQPGAADALARRVVRSTLVTRVTLDTIPFRFHWRRIESRNENVPYRIGENA